MTDIVPAILTNDVSDFRKKHAELLSVGQYFTSIHVDFIDGEFLPGRTVMPSELMFLRSPFRLGAHFMTHNPEQYFETIKLIGFKSAMVQYEAFADDDEAIAAIKKGQTIGLEMGVALNPETLLHQIGKLLKFVSSVQIMGVRPGAQGRSFEPNTLEKIKELRALAPNIIIAVDGGIKLGLAIKCQQAGADHIIVGSAIMASPHPKEMLQAFTKELQKN